MLKKVLLGILGVLVLLVGGVLALASTKPDTFSVERHTTIAASPAIVYANLDDFHRWAAWSPWEKLDPGMKKTYGGPAKGVGSTYAWSGNDDVGEGRMTVLESDPNRRLVVRLEFIKPFATTSTTVYTLEPAAAGGTELTWSMDGPNSFPGKIMSVFVDMDAMIGKDFEKGLADLKRISESGTASASN
jgi:uncharacterized protein YndB with AHSA1/START domain